MSLELGESHLDGVQVWRVLRQEEHPGAATAQHCLCLGAHMDGQVVENDDIAFGKGGGQLGFDIGIEGFTVDGAIDDPRCCQPVRTQSRDEGLGAPPSGRNAGFEALSAARPATQPCHLRGDRRFIDEHQSPWLTAHARLASGDPKPSPFSDVGAIALRCH